MANQIHKHWIGYVIIGLSGSLLLVGLILGMWASYIAGLLTLALFGILSTLIVAVVLFTLLSLWFYYWPVLIYGTSNVTITNWLTFFSSVQAEAEWIEIEDVTVRKPGILAQLFDYGTITIETAGTKPNLSISRMPHAEELRDQMMRTVETIRGEVQASAANSTN